MYRKFLVFTFIFLSSLFVKSQSFNFDYYGLKEGIPEDFAYAITQDENGYLLVSTDKGIFKFNGFKFEHVYKSQNDEKVLNSFRASNGDIYFGMSKNGIIKYSQGTFTNDTLLSEISKVRAIIEDDKNSIWITTQKSGLFEIDKTGKINHYIKGIEKLNIFSFMTTSNGLLIGTDEGLYQGSIKSDSTIVIAEVEDIFYTSISSISKSNQGYYVGTEGSGVFQVKCNETSELQIELFRVDEIDLTKYQVNHIFQDENNSLWISTNRNGLIQIGFDKNGNCNEVIHYYQENMENARAVNMSFIDKENNLWMASSDKGIVGLRNDFFSFYPMKKFNQAKKVLSLATQGNNEMWIGTEKNVILCSLSPWSIKFSYDEANGLPENEYSAICKDKNNTIWAGSLDAGLFYKKTESEVFEKFIFPQAYGKNINQIVEDDGKLYVSTHFGLIIIENEEIVYISSMSDGFPHNKIHSVFPDGTDLWLATEVNKIGNYSNGEISIRNTNMSSLARETAIMQYTKSTDGNIWAGTDGAGISRINENDTLWMFDKHGLWSNYIHSIIGDNNNRLLMSHRGGLTKYEIETEEIQTYTPISGSKVDFSLNAVVKDEKGLIWFGSNKGLLSYRSDKDIKNSISPVVSFNGIEIKNKGKDIDSTYSGKEPIYLDYGKYNLTIKFEGISLKKPEGVSYQYYLEGEEDLSEKFREDSYSNIARYNNLEPGEYVFKVVAINSDGVEGEEYSVNINIASPFWTKWWFFILIGVTGYLIMRTIIKVRERQYIKNREILERKLAERTSEVVEQKEEIEAINIDLMDSIDYAKNIQTAILPAPDMLDNIFGSASVFYKPRDVVSGDFYWVETHGDKILVAVADCTGHGVPGAFMSLIGSALLKEISSRTNVNSPDKIMSILDKEMTEMLNKKDSRFGVQDGMDITVIEFNRKTQLLRYSSGRRPIVIYRDGVQESTKGDRASIGGYKEAEEKIFTLHECQLQKGDRLYMYSDGIVDQFGGERGKKLKNKAFLSYLDSIQSLTMNEQHPDFVKFFDEWKGELTQIDDVIVVGIEV